MTQGTNANVTAADAARQDGPEAFRYERIQRVKEWVQAHYLSNPSNADGARACGLSEFHFNREFSRIAGETFKHYVDHLRIEEAKRCLLEGQGIGHVSAVMGFAHQSHFTTRFKHYVGETPRAWRQRALIEQGGRKAEAA